MIVHHHQKEICLRIEKMKTIPGMAIIKENSQELSYFLVRPNYPRTFSVSSFVLGFFRD